MQHAALARCDTKNQQVNNTVQVQCLKTCFNLGHR